MHRPYRVANGGIKMTENFDWADFFHGGLPPYQFFRLSFDELTRLVASSKVEGGVRYDSGSLPDRAGCVL